MKTGQQWTWVGPTIAPTLDTSADTVLWRYMDLAKFIALISGRQLYLPAAARFPDQYEGTVNRATYEYYRQSVVSSMEGAGRTWPGKFLRIRHAGQWIEIPVLEDLEKGIHQALECLRARTYISCWHQNEHESEAMWKLYVPDRTQGVAVRTTRSLLDKALPDGCQCERVRYVDYAGADLIKLFSAPFLTKRAAFSHEREWRVISQRLPEPSQLDGDAQVVTLNADAPPGLSVPLLLPLDKVFTEVRLSPEAPPWVRDVCADLLKKYDVPLNLLASSLAQNPFSPY